MSAQDKADVEQFSFPPDKGQALVGSLLYLVPILFRRCIGVQCGRAGVPRTHSMGCCILPKTSREQKLWVFDISKDEILNPDKILSAFVDASFASEGDRSSRWGVLFDTCGYFNALG